MNIHVMFGFASRKTTYYKDIKLAKVGVGRKTLKAL